MREGSKERLRLKEKKILQIGTLTKKENAGKR